MPIYEYKCSGCGHHFEYLVLPASPAAACPSCQSQDLEQMISLFAVSSAATRQTHLKAARKRAGKNQREKQHEEHMSMYHNPDHDH